MKLPAPPPTTQSIFDEALKSNRIERIITASSREADAYLHWDELRHRNPPDELSHREWWGALKLKRMAGAREIPLRDKKGEPFRFAHPDLVLEKLHDVDRGFGMLIGGTGGLVNRDMKDQFLIRSLINEAISSSQLEGAATTRQVAAEMLQTGRRPRDKSEQMITNNFATMRALSEWDEEPLSIELVLRMHRMVTEATLEIPDAAGRFRNADEPIVVRDRATNTVLHVPPPASELLERMERMCAFANETGKPFVHPVIRAVLLHFWLGYDHPFVDGNGRTARALFYWSMLRAGYWALEFTSISEIILRAPAKYARAFLHTETDDNDATYFLLHQLDVIQQARAELHAYLERKDQELRSADNLLAAGADLNHRQRALLAHALRHPGARYSVEVHRATNNVAYETARKDLLALYKLGWLEMRKVGKAFHFTAPGDMRVRIAGGRQASKQEP